MASHKAYYIRAITREYSKVPPTYHRTLKYACIITYQTQRLAYRGVVCGVVSGLVASSLLRMVLY